MTVEEYWKCFLTALRMDRSLQEELTRITMTDVDMEPEDWSTFLEVHHVAERLGTGIDDVIDLIERGEIGAKEIGDANFLIPLASLKEYMFYDPKRLLEVPWDEIVNQPPPRIVMHLDRCDKDYVALMVEARYLERMASNFNTLKEEFKQMEVNGDLE